MGPITGAVFAVVLDASADLRILSIVINSYHLLVFRSS